MDKQTFSREELYDLVWSQPLLVLAKKYAISDVGLRKTCGRMGIPLPKAGHWQKLKFGKKVRRVPLHGNYAGAASVSLVLRDTTAPLTAKGESPLAVLKRRIEAEIPKYLTVPEKLTAPHPLILSARASLNASKVDTYLFKGTVSCSCPELDIRVSRESVGRALRFLDTLIKALQARGHTIAIQSRATCLTVDGIDYDLRSCARKCEKKEKQGTWDSTVYYPTGILALQLDYCSPGEWKDGKVTLETKVSQIIAQVELSAKERKAQQLQRQIQEEQRNEKERLQREFEQSQEEELRDFKAMLAKADRWHKANNLRAFIDAVESEAQAGNRLSSELTNWLQWARKKADWYDPFVEAEDDLLNGADKDTLGFPIRRSSFW